MYAKLIAFQVKKRKEIIVIQSKRDFIADSACEKDRGASQVLSRARAKLAMLKKAQATGEYDSAELENAIAHALFKLNS